MIPIIMGIWAEGMNEVIANPLYFAFGAFMIVFGSWGIPYVLCLFLIGEYGATRNLGVVFIVLTMIGIFLSAAFNVTIGVIFGVVSALSLVYLLYGVFSPKGE